MRRLKAPDRAAAMLFNSTVFFLFFAAFFAVYWRLGACLRTQNILVLAGSLFFYGWWDERFLLLIAASTAVDFIAALGASGERVRAGDLKKAGLYLGAVSLAATLPTFGDSWRWLLLTGAFALAGGVLALVIERARGDRRKLWLITSLCANLGLLGVFKYFGFFTESFIAAAERIGFSVNAPMMEIVLPIGISFYTFQTLSYTIDVWRGEMRATRRLVDFAAYVSFFPQLVAGPIERAKALLPQFERARRWNTERAGEGVMLFLWGLYKKTVIADNLAPIVNAAFAAPAETAPALMLLGVLGFAVQIYCDFSGYSDMARGLARMLGFELMVNFDLPYFSRTPSEFWRRWHISLSSWLRDYLYVPLGGNRGGKLATYRNLILTMLLGGLWHGAAWTFIVWGAFHGAILAIYRALSIDALIARAKGSGAIVVHVIAWGLMSILTLIGWTFFRAQSLPEALIALKTAFTAEALRGLSDLPEGAIVLSLTAPLIIANIANRFFASALKGLIDEGKTAGALPMLARTSVLLALLCCVTFLSAEGQQDFIYFDF
ncbi:MAG: MBOAT family O-acyltransferase [Parvularculaceae bacterium]|nr:MBOAT family O-acyltransferase [Parvularculaceae bacterium]